MFDHYSTEPVFNVKAIAHQTGVAAATLRAWERRYGVPSPPRTDSGYRLYSAKDVAMIRWLKGQVDNGMSISQAVQLLNSVATHSANGHGTDQPFAQVAPSSYQRLHDDIVSAAVEFDEEHIESALSEAFSLFSVEDVCLNVVQPVLQSLGKLWHSGEITVSVEHFASNLMRRKLLTLMTSSPAPTRNARIVAACAPGEYHELGILMLSLFLRRRGYNVVYLGQNIAATRLQEMLAKTQPDLLLLSASGLPSAANLLDVCQDLRRADGHAGLTIAFGGRVFNRLPALEKHVFGLYIGEDAIQAMNRIVEVIANARGAQLAALANEFVQHAEPAAAEALTAFRLRRADIVSATVRLTASHDRDEYSGRQAFETAENLVDIVDALLRFGEPEILTQPVNWQWDALPPDGLGSLRLKVFAAALAEATRSVVGEPHLAFVWPYLHALEKGFESETMK